MATTEDFTTGDNHHSEKQKAADDWLTAFARKSKDALAERAAAKTASPLPDEKELIAALARKDHTDYDRVRAEVAETLGMRVGTLDDKVEDIRKDRKKERDDNSLAALGGRAVAGAGRRRRTPRSHPSGVPPLHRHAEGCRHRTGALGPACLDDGCRRHLALHGAGFADQAVRQDQPAHPLVLPDAEVGTREQHHAVRAVPLRRGAIGRRC